MKPEALLQQNYREGNGIAALFSLDVS